MSDIIGYDPYSGITEKVTKEDGKIIVSTHQDVENTLEHNAKDLNNDSGNWKGDLHKVASIPMNVVNDWVLALKKQGRNPNPFCQENRKFLIAKLNNRDFSKFRTKGGTV